MLLKLSSQSLTFDGDTEMKQQKTKTSVRGKNREAETETLDEPAGQTEREGGTLICTWRPRLLLADAFSSELVVGAQRARLIQQKHCRAKHPPPPLAHSEAAESSSVQSKRRLRSRRRVWVCQTSGATPPRCRRSQWQTAVESRGLVEGPRASTCVSLWKPECGCLTPLWWSCCRSSTCSFTTPSWRRVYVGTQPYQCASSEPFTTTSADWTHRPTPARLKTSSRWARKHAIGRFRDNFIVIPELASRVNRLVFRLPDSEYSDP